MSLVAGERPLWKEVPARFLFGEEDRNMPAAPLHHMAERAGARRTIEIPGASHAVAVSQPDATAQLILEVAVQPVAACPRARRFLDRTNNESEMNVLIIGN